MVDLFSSIFENYQTTSGIAISIVIKNTISHIGTFGLSNKETNTQVTEDTLFPVASISKIITAIAILQLYEQNLIDLDGDINQYIKLRVIHPKHPEVSITPKLLMMHMSGLNDNENGLHIWKNKEGDSPIALEEQVRRHLTSDGEFFNWNQWSDGCPGSSYWYSNAGFTLLGYIVEQVAKKPFNDYVKEKIFEPIGIFASYFIRDLDLNLVAMPYRENIPLGYYGVPEFPACQLRISIKDLSKVLLFFTSGSVNGVKLLSSETVEIMCPQSMERGLAWWGRDSWYGKKRGRRYLVSWRIYGWC